MTFDYPGYPLTFIQRQRCKDETAHQATFIYKFYSPVTRYHYIVRAEHHDGNVFAIKFYCKKDRKVTFVISGNVEMDAVCKLVNKYIGNLYASDSKQMYARPDNLQFRSKQSVGLTVKTFKEGVEDDGKNDIRITFPIKTGSCIDARNRISILASSLQTQLYSSLRINLGKVYSVNCNLSSTESSQDSVIYDLEVQMSTLECSVDSLVAKILEVVQTIKNDGLSKDIFDAGYKSREDALKKYYRDHYLFATHAIEQTVKGESVEAATVWATELEKVTREEVNESAKIWLGELLINRFFKISRKRCPSN